ncbi:hypothetical protein G5I_14760 [Acromyrmex echinatior]|uniref:Uncharacterized protein n=1 Tax=Acromyrmex echinatior TaxID=103372 RepID=F4X8M1_ACREC|nr:hypothetical protein G5I_14760 [Acromyrmex echinatior]
MSPGFVAVQETRGSDLCLLLDLLMIRQSQHRQCYDIWRETRQVVISYEARELPEERPPLFPQIAVRWVRATVLQVAQVTPTRPGGALTFFHVVGISREAAVAWIVSDSKLVSFTSRHLGTGPTQHDTFVRPLQPGCLAGALDLPLPLCLATSTTVRSYRRGTSKKRDGDRWHRGVQCTDHAYQVHRDWPDPIHVAMVTFLRPSVRQHRELRLCRLIIPSTYSRAGYMIPTVNVLPPLSSPAGTSHAFPSLTGGKEARRRKRDREREKERSMYLAKCGTESKRGFTVADDSFRLLSFMLPQRPFRYTTGNRQRLRLVRVKSDYGTSGIISSFSKDTIYPRLS